MKRKRSADDASGASKKANCRARSAVERNLLQVQYSQVVPLRHYVLARLPGSSRLRRRKIQSFGLQEDVREEHIPLRDLLDQTLICTDTQQLVPVEDLQHRWSQYLSFSQKGDESHITLSDGVATATAVLSEVLDFIIWLLFSREPGFRPKNLLCDGFKKSAGEGVACVIPGICAVFPNGQVRTLKSDPWPQLMALLGKSGERIMIDLLTDCSIFVPTRSGFQNFHQLTGIPLSELTPRALTPVSNAQHRTPSDISLVRSRILYGKPTLTTKGRVKPGLKQIHTLNQPSRTPQDNNISLEKDLGHPLRMLMYLFPFQFGLHNVFSSVTDRNVTAQKFHDYTSRSGEISSRLPQLKGNRKEVRIPKRLRFAAKILAEKLQKSHKRCSYFALLRHYCPTLLDEAPPLRFSQDSASQRTVHQSKCCDLVIQRAGEGSITDLACPQSQVSAFCQAVLSSIIPLAFWGEGDTARHNRGRLLQKVDHFVKLRRFENMTLHEIVQGFRVGDIAWLRLPEASKKASHSDINKRKQIFNEFLYYVFDSLLIPLIRNNFYATESNTDKSRIFYFRYDVWKVIAEPAVAHLKQHMFEELKSKDDQTISADRQLGFSQLRLLPKGSKLRPIMNLRKRTLDPAPGKGLRQSINSKLGPVHVALQYEKDRNRAALGSTVFSISEIYRRLKAYKLDHGGKKLYFAKVDVHAAFDTIPQRGVISLMDTILQDGEYTMARHAEVRPREPALPGMSSGNTSFSKRWHSVAVSHEERRFDVRLERRLAVGKKNTVFVGIAGSQVQARAKLWDLLTSHVACNLVKIGKKYYRQKRGIPQGSVLSSLLCNYFYAAMETEHLDFISSESLLMRLTDDILLITPHKQEAEQFMRVMHAGLPDYGVEIGREKSLANFRMELHGQPVNQVGQGEWFPYCGIRIDCESMEVSRDRERVANADIANSFTVEHGRKPGQTFQRKVLNFFKVQSHLIYFDTSHNSAETALHSLQEAFRETASKMWAYHRALPRSKQPPQALIISAICQLIYAAHNLLTGPSRKVRYKEYVCNISRAQVARTAHTAFLSVLSQKQTNFREVTDWLQKQARLF